MIDVVSLASYQPAQFGIEVGLKGGGGVDPPPQYAIGVNKAIL